MASALISQRAIFLDYVVVERQRILYYRPAIAARWDCERYRMACADPETLIPEETYE